MKFILIALITFLSLKANAQNRNSVWCFGDSAGIDFRIPASPVPISTGMDTRGTCASICDSAGNLLFYAGAGPDGTWTPNGKVYNSNHQLMLNGNDIYAAGFYDELLIIPKPGSNFLYYIFSINTYVFDPVGTFYSIVDMSGDGGRGSVIEKNVQIAGDSLCGAMTAVKHGNGRDWWLLIKGYSALGDSTFYEYLITPDTILQTVINIGGNSWTSLGNLCFNKEGNKIAFVSFAGLIETFDFDRCTGVVSNSRVIRRQFPNNSLQYFGACFSPNSNLLYVADEMEVSRLFQFDLNLPNPFLDRDTLAVISTSRYGGGNLRLGPDNKIYWAIEWDPGGTFPYPYQANMYSQYNMNLSVIENPDVLGSGCNLNLFSFYLGGKRTYWGLPINPDYEMQPLWGSTCDSLTNDIDKIEENQLTVFPNPFTNVIYFNSGDQIKSIRVYNCLGEIILTENLNGKSELNVSKLSFGTYYFEFISEKNVLRRKLVKVN